MKMAHQSLMANDARVAHRFSVRNKATLAHWWSVMNKARLDQTLGLRMPIPINTSIWDKSTCIQCGSNLGSNWIQYGFNIEPIWIQFGRFKTEGPIWIQFGFNLDSIWIILESSESLLYTRAKRGKRRGACHVFLTTRENSYSWTLFGEQQTTDNEQAHNKPQATHNTQQTNNKQQARYNI